MQPLDPGRGWLAAGITGLPRQREWHVVETVDAPGEEGQEAQFVVLADGRVLIEDGASTFDPGPLVEALAGAVDRPYRAVALRRPDVWAVGASSIAVESLALGPDGADFELTSDGEALSLSVNGIPADPARAAPLRALAESRERGAYAAQAHRLADDLWEIQVLPL